MDSIQFVPVPAAQQNDDEEVGTEDLIEEVQVERTDSEFDLQLRIWQQFMRVPSSSIYRSLKTSAATTIENQIDPSILT